MGGATSDRLHDRFHIRLHQFGGRVTFQPENPAQNIADLLQFRSGEIPPRFRRFHPDPSPDMVDLAERFLLFEHKTHIAHKLAFKFPAVVAFDGDFVIPAEDCIKHDLTPFCNGLQ